MTPKRRSGAICPMHKCDMIYQYPYPIRPPWNRRGGWSPGDRYVCPQCVQEARRRSLIGFGVLTAVLILGFVFAILSLLWR